MATANPTDQQKTKKTNPPTVGDRPSVRIDEDLAADLADIMGTGDVTFTDAVRQAVGQLALMYRTAWAHEVCPPGTAPVILAYQLGKPSDTKPTRPIGRMLTGPPPGRQLRPTHAEELLSRPTGTPAPARPDAERPARA